MRDSQRQAVYDWNHACAKLWPSLAQKLTLEECGQLVEKVWRQFLPERKAPVIKDGRGRRRPSGNRLYIKLPQFARTVEIVLHELAHSILDAKIVGGAPHGPEYARLCAELYSKYLRVSIKDVLAIGRSQKPRKVKFAPAAKGPKPVKQKMRAWQKKLDELKAQRAKIDAEIVEHHQRKPA